MRKNIGPTDQLIRFIFASALVAAGSFAPITAGWRALLFILATFELVSAVATY